MVIVAVSVGWWWAFVAVGVGLWWVFTTRARAVDRVALVTWPSDGVSWRLWAVAATRAIVAVGVGWW
jgi:hypothetical protein